MGLAVKFLIEDIGDRMTPEIAKAIAEIGGPTATMPEVVNRSTGHGFGFRSDITWEAGRLRYNYRSFGRDPDFGTPKNTLSIAGRHGEPPTVIQF